MRAASLVGHLALAARSLIRVLARMKGCTSNEVAAAEDVIDTSLTDSLINPALLAWAQAVETDRKIDGVRDRVKHTTRLRHTLKYASGR